ncbi:MAG: hypothetical protein JRH11_05055 [Deltaproteobacteria bacterium]|nr:hypothetical protein [Deltaproteobacteria bacterium]
MVALVAGAIAITSIYFVSSASSRHFHEQQRIAQSQMNLRTAAAQVRRDFSRAGYLGSPNTVEETVCPDATGSVDASTTDFGAIEVLDGDATLVLTEASTNGVEADTVRLTGNFASGDAYKVAGTQTSTTLNFATTWQGFRRSFGVPYDDALLTSVMQAGRFVHIVNDGNGGHWFAQITSVSATTLPPTITIDRGLPDCFRRCVDGCTLSPLSKIEYTVISMADPTLSALNAGSPVAGSTGAVLVRRELTFADVLVANSQRIVAEYVADFDVDLISNTQLGAGLPLTLVLQDDANAETVSAANPHLVRSAVIRLSLRTSTEDQRFPYVARAAGAALTRFDINTAIVGAARVRTTNLEVLLTNVAVQDMR